MRVLFVHERFGSFGGAEGTVLLTARELRARGHDVGMIFTQATTHDEPVWSEAFPQRYNCSTGGAVAVRSAIRDFVPDALYVHKMADMQIVEGLLDSGVPSVRSVHDHDLYCMRSYKYFPWNRKICTRAASSYCVYGCGASLKRKHTGFPLQWVSYRQKRDELRLNRGFDRLLVASAYMKGELIRNGFEPGRIEVHPPAVQSLAPVTPANFSDRNRIIFIGQVIRGKGVDVLVRALREVSVPFECTIIGDGHHRNHCEMLSARLGLADRVTFTGFLPDPKVEAFYADSSVAVMSSVWPEPFGAAGLHAMQHALPVVAFDVGGVREWLISAYNGFAVPWMDHHEFARRIDELLRNKTHAREMGHRGRRMVEQKFNLSAYITGVENMLTQLLGEQEAVA